VFWQITQSAFPAVCALVASKRKRLGVVIRSCVVVAVFVVMVSLSPEQEKISIDNTKVLTMVLIRFIGFFSFRCNKFTNQIYAFSVVQNVFVINKLYYFIQKPFRNEKP
jgi:hypothetical protein